MDDLNYEVNLKSADKVGKTPERSIKGLLNIYTLDRIKMIYSNLAIDNIVDGGKKEYINAIYNILSKPRKDDLELNSLIKSEYDELVELCKNDGIIQDNDFSMFDYIALIDVGLIYVYNYNDKIYIAMPKEIEDILKNLDMVTDIELNTREFDLAMALVNLHGVFLFDKYEEYVEKFYGYESINFRCVFNSSRVNYLDYTSLNENEDETCYIRSRSIFEEDIDYDRRREALFRSEDIEDYDYKEMSLDEILKYKNFNYYSKTKETEALRDYLRKFNSSEKDLENIVSDIAKEFRRDYDDGMKVLIDLLENSNFDVNKINMDELISKINDVIFNIPIWGNKGWTYKEILKMKI